MLVAIAYNITVLLGFQSIIIHSQLALKLTDNLMTTTPHPVTVRGVQVNSTLVTPAALLSGGIDS